MPNFVVFPDGQLAVREQIIAVKKVKFADGLYVRVQLGKDLGVVDVFCGDEERQTKTLQDVTNAVLNLDRAGVRDEDVKH